jgi:hypothetical protein
LGGNDSLVKAFEKLRLITFDTEGTISLDAAAIVDVSAGTASVDRAVGNGEFSADRDAGTVKGVSRIISSVQKYES